MSTEIYCSYVILSRHSWKKNNFNRNTVETKELVKKDYCLWVLLQSAKRNLIIFSVSEFLTNYTSYVMKVEGRISRT